MACISVMLFDLSLLSFDISFIFVLSLNILISPPGFINVVNFLISFSYSALGFLDVSYSVVVVVGVVVVCLFLYRFSLFESSLSPYFCWP